MGETGDRCGAPRYLAEDGENVSAFFGLVCVTTGASENRPEPGWREGDFSE